MLATALAVGAVAGCTSSGGAPTPTASRAPRTGAAAPAATSPGASTTTWLCRPGQRPDPCTSDLTATTVAASGARAVQHAAAAADPPVDCFYVYPTVSRQPGRNATLHVDPEETAVAVAQAARFSQACRVFAPVYPQLTRAAIGAGGGTIDPRAALTAYSGVVSAWQDYLAHDNHGRGVVLIGHSQGAFLLTAMIKLLIDPNPALRRHLVSALLLGGNVTVPRGRLVGGDFAHVPACTSGRQTGCVVAYSSFASVPPADSLFARPGTSIAAGLGGGSTAGMQVLCTDPARLDGSGGRLRAYFPTTPLAGVAERAAPAGVHTPWVGYPDAFTARCRTSGGASWLQVGVAHRPAGLPSLAVVQQALGPRWGLHEVDVNIALGNLVRLVRDEAAAYTG